MWLDIETLARTAPPTEAEKQRVLDYIARRAKARFYADENFPTQAVSLLREVGARVYTAQDVGLVGHPDEDHAAYALKHGLILLTCDRDFLDNKRFPLIHCPAIFVFDFGSGTEREMKQAFRCLAAVIKTPQFFDKWWKADAKRDCWTEFARYQNGATSRHRYRLFRGKLQEWVAHKTGRDKLLTIKSRKLSVIVATKEFSTGESGLTLSPFYLRTLIFGMSALPPKADMCGALGHVRFGPKADIDRLRPHA